MKPVYRKLGEICSVRRGTTITKKQTIEGSVPVIGGGTKPTYFHNEYNRKANCITISGSGASAGFVNQWDVPIFASDCSTVEPKDNTQLSEFIYYFLLSKQEYIYKNFRSGAAQPHVYAKDIGTLEYPILSITEQQRIVAKLDAAFAKVDKTSEAIKKIIQNSKRFYSYSIDNEFAKYADKTKPIGEYSNINYGYTAKASYEKGRYKFLRITDIQDNAVDWDSVPYCEVEKKKLSSVLLNDGDIVFARTGATTGKSFLLEDPVDSVFASYLIRLSVDKQVFLPKYVMHYFQSAKYWQQVKKGISGAAQGGFNAKKLGGLIIPLIDKTQQLEIIKKLDLISEQSSRLQNAYEIKMHALSRLKSAILIQELKLEKAA